jgi:DNA polymerase I-like protein with 3'-5' exonuclease and polymerase domains
MTKEEAEVLISSFKSKYSRLNDFLNKIILDCRSKGYIYTILGIPEIPPTKQMKLGRKRFLPEINSSIPKERRRAERQAVNSVCQGSAADIAKMAMIKIYQSINSNGYRAALVLQLHDELLFEVKEDHVEAVKAIIKECMENTMPLSVPLPVKISTGKSWGSLEEDIVQ